MFVREKHCLTPELEMHRGKHVAARCVLVLQQRKRWSWAAHRDRLLGYCFYWCHTDPKRWSVVRSNAFTISSLLACDIPQEST